MDGRVEQGNRALIDVQIRASRSSAATTISVWIDTGFTGDLVLPRSFIENLELSQSSNTDATLADGSNVTLPTYECFIDWFGRRVQLQVVRNVGNNALLGTGLLRGHELFISYITGHLKLE